MDNIQLINQVVITRIRQLLLISSPPLAWRGPLPTAWL